MARIRRYFFLITALFFLGCAAKFEVPILPNFAQKEFAVKSGEQNLRLIVAHNDENFRFALFDSLGAPIVDRALKNGSFGNTKFLPLSSRFDELFAGVLKLIQSDANFAAIKTSNDEFEVKYVH